jgi:membrane-associated protease RseP (regulator of RpoE activity)
MQGKPGRSVAGLLLAVGFGWVSGGELAAQDVKTPTADIVLQDVAYQWFRVGDAETTARALLSTMSGLEKTGTHWIGAEVVPADPTLRSQLGLPDGQGLVVSWIHQGSPAAQAGLESHDVLLELASKSLATTGDFTAAVDAAGDKPSGLIILRHGKRLTLQVTPTPARRVGTLAADALAKIPGGAPTPRIWIGVELAAPDETLRSQLSLGEDQGVVVANVVDESPASSAGVKKHDVILKLGEKLIASSEDLRARLQEVGEAATPVKLLREGKPISIQVTPKKHSDPSYTEMVFSFVDAQRQQPLHFEVMRPAVVADLYRRVPENLNLEVTVTTDPAAAPTDPQKRVQELIDQMKDLQKKLEALSEDLKKKAADTPSSEKK